MIKDEVNSFKNRLVSVDKKFAKIDKRSHNLANIKKAYTKNKGNHFNLNLETWQQCCRLGVPCSSRIMISESTCTMYRGKELKVACTEKRVCLHSLGAISK